MTSKAVVLLIFHACGFLVQWLLIMHRQGGRAAHFSCLRFSRGGFPAMVFGLAIDWLPTQEPDVCFLDSRLAMAIPSYLF